MLRFKGWIGKGLEGRHCGLLDVLSWYMLGETLKNHKETCQDGWWPSQHSNQPPWKYKSTLWVQQHLAQSGHVNFWHFISLEIYQTVTQMSSNFSMWPAMCPMILKASKHQTCLKFTDSKELQNVWLPFSFILKCRCTQIPGAYLSSQLNFLWWPLVFLA